jgi:hypothetical protein
VKAKAKGKAKITATVSGKKATCLVTVKSAAKVSATEAPASQESPLPADTSPEASGSGQGTDTEIAASSPPTLDSSVLVASSQLVTGEDGTVMTAYVINKLFKGDIHINFNGKVYSTSGKGRTLLSFLADGATTKTNGDGTLRVSRESLQEEYWTIEDLSQGRTYYMKATMDNPVDTSVGSCGVIYIVGDVLSEVQIY